jgi:hypothetical protein
MIQTELPEEIHAPDKDIARPVFKNARRRNDVDKVEELSFTPKTGGQADLTNLPIESEITDDSFDIDAEWLNSATFIDPWSDLAHKLGYDVLTQVAIVNETIHL